MLSNLPNFLRPPTFEDERQTYAAQILNLVLLVAIVALAVLFVNNLFVYGITDVRPYTALAVLVVLLGAFALVKMRHVRLSGIIVLTVGWLATSYLVYLGGIRVSGIKFYVVLIIVAVATLGMRSMVAVLVASILSVTAFYYAETQGLIIYDPARYPLSGYYSDFIVIFSLIFAVLGLYSWQLGGILTRAQADEHELADRNRQLQTTQDNLEKRITARTHKLETSAVLSERLNTILDENQLLQELVKEIKNQFNYYHAQVYMLDTLSTKEQDRFTLVAGAGQILGNIQTERHQIDHSNLFSPVLQAARNNRMIMIEDVSHAASWQPNPLLPDIQSEVAVPIVLDEQVVGVLEVMSDQVTGFDEGDVTVLRLLANQTAVALRNARLFAQVERTLAEAQATQTRYEQQAWQQVALQTKPEYNYHRPGTDPLPEETVVRLKETALVERQPTVIANEKSQLALVMPIKLQNQIIGTMHFSENEPARRQSYTEQEIALVQAIADQVAQTAENLRLFDETRQRADYERLVGEITQEIRQAPNLDMLAKTATEAINNVLGTSGGGIRLNIDSRNDSDNN